MNAVMIKNKHGIEFSIEMAVRFMDKEIYGKLCTEFDDDQDFFNAYCAAHKEKFGKESALNTENPGIVRNEWDVEFVYEAIVPYMDDEIREDLCREIAPCTEQEFFDAYCKAHEEKFGEEFELAKRNPIW